jgi:hypothetical protein
MIFINLRGEKKMPYVSSFERVGLEKGLEIGRQEGREKGREEGQEEGEAIGLRKGIALALEIKFGPAGAKFMGAFDKVRKPSVLAAIQEAILAASSVDDLPVRLEALIGR